MPLRHVVVASIALFVTAAEAAVTWELRPVSTRQNGGGMANATSTRAAVVADGTIVFESLATDLVGAPTNGLSQVFANDGSATALLSRSPAGQPGNLESSTTLGVSRDGRFVALGSLATNLVAGFVDRTPGESQAYRVDRSSGAIVLLSRVPQSATTPGNAGSFGPILAPSGTCAAFASAASDLTPHAQAADFSTFVWIDGVVQLVAVNTAGTATANATSLPVAVSADCRFVLFNTSATDVIAGATGRTQAYLRDVVAGTTTLVSHAAGLPLQPGNAFSAARAMSPDARFVALDGLATDLVAGQSDTAGSNDVFVWERDTGAIRLVSHASGVPTQAANAPSRLTANQVLSDDGMRLAYHSDATNLVAVSDTNADFDAFLWMAETGASVLLSRSASGNATGNAASVTQFVSADGRFVAIGSDASDLVAGVADTNGTTDALVYDATEATLRVLSLRPGTSQTANGYSYPFAVSPDGRFVALVTEATDLSALPDANGTSDVFRAERIETLFANGFE